MAAVTATIPGGYSAPKLVDSLCITKCNDGPCRRGDSCSRDVEVMNLLRDNIGTIEDRLHAAGWNGMIRNTPHRLVPISYQTQVVAVCLKFCMFF